MDTLLNTSLAGFTPLLGVTGILETESVEYLFHLLGGVFFFLVSVWIVVDLLGKLFAPEKGTEQDARIVQPIPAPLQPPPSVPVAVPAPVAVAPSLPPAVPAATPQEESAEIIAVIAAAVATVVGGPHRITSIEYVPTTSRLAWSMEGRRAIYASHSVRR